MNKKIFSKVLVEQRELSGMTQEEIAEKSDLSSRYIQMLEAGQSIPTVEALFKIAFALKVTPDELIQPAWESWVNQLPPEFKDL